MILCVVIYCYYNDEHDLVLFFGCDFLRNFLAQSIDLRTNEISVALSFDL